MLKTIAANESGSTRRRRNGTRLVLVSGVTAILCLVMLVALSGGGNRSHAPLRFAGSGEEPGWWTQIVIVQLATSHNPESDETKPQLEGRRITATVPSDVLFAEGSAELEDAAREMLIEVTGTLKQAAGIITVVGHTDLLGAEGANQLLGESRAEAVVGLLVELGVAADRLTSVSLGESEPLCAQTNADGTDNPDCRARCRRVVITFTLKTAESPTSES